MTISSSASSMSDWLRTVEAETDDKRLTVTIEKGWECAQCHEVFEEANKPLLTFRHHPFCSRLCYDLFPRNCVVCGTSFAPKYSQLWDYCGDECCSKDTNREGQ